MWSHVCLVIGVMRGRPVITTRMIKEDLASEQYYCKKREHSVLKVFIIRSV